MGIKACKNQNCGYEYNLIENDNFDILTTFDKMVFNEFKDLRRMIESINHSRVNMQVGVFKLSDPNKFFKRFVKWYKIGYTDPISNRLKNRLSVKKLNNFFESTEKKSQIDHISKIKRVKKEDLLNENEIEKNYENHFFNFDEDFLFRKQVTNQFFEISICHGNKNSQILQLERKIEYTSKKDKSDKNHKNNKEKIEYDFEKDICYSNNNVHNTIKDENFVLKENLKYDKEISNSIKKENIKKSEFKSKKKSKNKYEKESLISFSLIRETELSISKSSSYDENNRDSSKFVSNNLKIFFNKNTNYFKDCVTKGLPNSFRWKIWMICANINSPILESNFLSYFDMHLDEITEKQIRKDISRSNSNKCDLNSDNSNKKESLYKLLKAFANNDKEIGYCQGMNFIASLILEISDFNEIESFYLMQSLFSNTFSNHLGIRGFFANDFPLLHFYIYVFDELFKTELTDLYMHFQSMILPYDCWLTRWFLTLFTLLLPSSITVRIWDCIFVHGINFIIKFSISLLDFIQAELLLAKDEFEVSDVFNLLKKESSTESQNFKENISLDVDDLIKRALKIEIKDIDKYKSNFEKKSKISLKKLDIKYDIKSSITYSLNTSLTNTTNLTITDIIHEQHNTSESSISQIPNNFANVKYNNICSPNKKSIFGFSVKENTSETFNLYKIKENENDFKFQKMKKENEVENNNNYDYYNQNNDDENVEVNDNEKFGIKKRKTYAFLNSGYNDKIIQIKNEFSHSNSKGINSINNESNINFYNLEKKEKDLVKDNNKDNISNRMNPINTNVSGNNSKTDNKKSSKKRNLLSCFEIVNNKNALDFSSPNKKLQSFLQNKDNISNFSKVEKEEKESEKFLSFNRGTIKLKTVFSSKPLHNTINDNNSMIYIFSEKNSNKCILNSNLCKSNKPNNYNTEINDKNIHNEEKNTLDILKNNNSCRSITENEMHDEKLIKFNDDENFVDEEYDEDEDEYCNSNADYLNTLKDKNIVNKFITKNNAEIFKKHV